MTTHLGLVFIIILSFEILKYLKLFDLLKSNINFYLKISKLLTFKRVSDTWKEKALLNYSKNLFIVSIKVILSLTLILACFSIFCYLDRCFYKFLLSLSGITETTFLFLIYSYFRNNYYAKL